MNEQHTIKTTQKAITATIHHVNAHPRAPQHTPLNASSNEVMDGRKQA
jgi:hypothetical protein